MYLMRGFVMKKLGLSLCVAVICASNVNLCFADNKNTSYVTAYGGLFETSDPRYRKGMGGLELRLPKYYQYISPKVGGFVTAKGSVYGYAGFNLDFAINDMLYVAPGIAAGLYSRGNGKNLGGTIEFLSSIEVGGILPNNHRIGVSYSHISNASIYKKNPGAENLLVTYSIPFSF
jgi:lipid A 3-O-deacylase